MLNSRGFRFAAGSLLVACGASPSPQVEAVPEQSIFDDANKPSIYDAGPPPIVDAAVPIVVEEDDEDAGDTSAPVDDDDTIRPLAITPSVPESAVRSGLDIFVADDGAPFIAAIDKRVAPGRVANSPFATELRTPLEKDAFAYRLLNFRMESNVSVHTLRHAKRAAGIALTISRDNRPILPVDWLRAVVAFKGVDEKASRPWYVGMSQRMSVAGRSSGLAIFDNGTAVGVLIEAQYEVGGEDLTVKARTEFFPGGGFDASAWGVVLNDVKGVATKNGDGHAGIDTRDLLSQALHVTLPVHP
jgi:hypothetical protein